MVKWEYDELFKEEDRMNKKSEEKETHNKFKETIMWKEVVDNKFVSGLFIALLLFSTLFVFTKISYLFAPVGQIFSIIGTPIIFSILFYYLFVPIVSYLEKKGLSRQLSVLTVFAAVLIVLALAVTFVIPSIRDQFKELIDNFPRIWASVLNQVEQLLYDEWLTEMYQAIQETQIITRVTEQVSNLFTVTIGSIGTAINLLTKIGVTLLTMPFILYYLLTDGHQFKNTLIKYTPTKMRPVMQEFLAESSKQVGSYVRGQLLVALAVTGIFYISYLIIDLEYALILSIIAGILNMIPYIGSIVSIIPAVIIGAFVSPFKLFQVIVVLAVEQFIEGRFVSPQILGSSLDIHPLLILFILLVSGSLFGFLGLVFGVPGFAVLRVIWDLFFEWIRENYDYYDEVPVEEKK